MSPSRRRLAFATVGALAAIVPAGVAWACVAVMSLTTSSPSVQPGGSIHVIGREFAQGAPIDIRIDAINGPLLATIPPPPTTMTSKWEADVPIPANTKYGQHTLFAVQNYHNMNAAVPRSIIYVGTLAPAEAGPESRPASLDVASGPSGMSLVLLGLGVAAAGLLVVGGISVLAGGRRSEAKAEPVTGK